MGWVVRRQTGSHAIMKKDGEGCLLSIPLHNEVSLGTLRGLVRSAGLTDERYREVFDS